MANIQIQNFTEQTTAASDDQILLQTAGGVTKKSKIVNLKRNGYKDLHPTGTFFTGGVTSPTTTTVFGKHKLLAFVGSGTTNEITAIFHLPHDYVESSDFYFHVHWLSTQASPTGTVEWRIDWQYARSNATGTYPTTDVVTNLPATAPVQYSHLTTESAAITEGVAGNTLRTDGVIMATLYRNTADSNNDNAFLISFDIHYLSDMTNTVERLDSVNGYTKV